MPRQHNRLEHLLFLKGQQAVPHPRQHRKRQEVLRLLRQCLRQAVHHLPRPLHLKQPRRMKKIMIHPSPVVNEMPCYHQLQISRRVGSSKATFPLSSLFSYLSRWIKESTNKRSVCADSVKGKERRRCSIGRLATWPSGWRWRVDG
jgi:hypothetical protein